MIEHVFRECGVVVNDLQGTQPDGTLITIRQLSIHDPSSGQLFHYAMDEEQARKVGGQLMGLGKIEVPTHVPPEFGDLKGNNGKGRK